MNLILNRDHLFSDFTIGSLFVDGVKQCWTLEDAVRERPGVPVEQWKVDEKTAIPEGNYEVAITYSNRFKRELPLIKDVPGFSGIRIHPGNTDEDTEGCILVGLVWDGDDFIGQSRVAFQSLFSKMQTAIANGEKIHLEVT